MVEQWPLKPCVVGSNPTTLTRIFESPSGFFKRAYWCGGGEDREDTGEVNPKLEPDMWDAISVRGKCVRYKVLQGVILNTGCIVCYYRAITQKEEGNVGENTCRRCAI